MADQLHIPDLLQMQRNNFPMLFLDGVTVVEPMKYVVGRKNFTFNEWFFPAHFPGDPLVPGFVLVEAMAQAFIMTFLVDKPFQGLETNLVELSKSRFRKPVKPGDTLESHAYLHSFRRGIAKGRVESFVLKEIVCEAEFVISIPQVLAKYRPQLPASTGGPQ